ncbi:gibberellin 2beta-dioxygenase [Ranunculus cassubicifolius]
MILDTRVASNPPLLDQFGAISHKQNQCSEQSCKVIQECELPLIDLSYLMSSDPKERQACAAEIVSASSEWGFFQVVNHGISPSLLGEMRREQMKVFEMPFEKKASCGLLNDSYRWGNPRATSPQQFSWSEAFHIPLTKISEDSCYGEFSSLREVMEEFASAMSKLAQTLAGVLAENLGHSAGVFEEICNESTCFLRLNRYPRCTITPEMLGLVPHTDSDFLTILYQDQVGGLQLMKDSKWVAVKPNPQALIVNVGDLFQAWSNDIYKSVEHKVMANEKVERYSIAYFLCPSYGSLIGSCQEPSVYKKFTFGDFRRQIQEDVKKTGHKVGLPRFLL